MKDLTTNDFLIGSYESFYSFDIDSWEYQMKQMADAGINFNIFPRTFGGWGDGKMFDLEYWKEVEELYAELNMIYFMNGGLSEELMDTGVLFANGLKHCFGYYVIDEPFGNALERVGEVVRAYRKKDGTRYPFVNLLPSYAGPEVLGGTYREHVEKFVDAAGEENIEYLSHDFYVFGENISNLGIFADMEVIRDVAFKHGKLKTHAYPQCTAWNGMRMPNIDEMRWNAYVYLAYGFKALSWFNLVCRVNTSETGGEGFRESVIHHDGSIWNPQLFKDFSALNWELRGLGNALMRLDTSHAYHTKNAGDGVETLPDGWLISPDGDLDFIVSYMVAKDNSEPHVMLFNKSWEKSVEATFKIGTHSGIKAVEYLNPFTGMYEPVDISSSTLEGSFRPGEGKLYRLKGNVQ